MKYTFYLYNLLWFRRYDIYCILMGKATDKQYNRVSKLLTQIGIGNMNSSTWNYKSLTRIINSTLKSYPIDTDDFYGVTWNLANLINTSMPKSWSSYRTMYEDYHFSLSLLEGEFCFLINRYSFYSHLSIQWCESEYVHTDEYCNYYIGEPEE